MKQRFLHAIWPILPGGVRRRVVVGGVLAAVVAGLDALGVILILPLAQLMTTIGAGQIPSSMQSLADHFGDPTPNQLALILAIAIVSCFVVKGLLALFVLRGTVRAALEAEAAMAGQLLHGYLDAPLEYRLTRNSAEMQRTLHESTRRVYQEALVTAVPALGDQLVVLAVTIVVLVVAPLEAVVGAVYMVLLVGLYRRLSARHEAASSDELIEQSRRSIQYVQQALDAAPEIQISGRRRAVRRSLARHPRTGRERANARSRSPSCSPATTWSSVSSSVPRWWARWRSAT